MPHRRLYWQLASHVITGLMLSASVLAQSVTPPNRQCRARQPDCARPPSIARAGGALREARPGEQWITPDESRLRLQADQAQTVPIEQANRARAASSPLANDATPPVLPDSLRAKAVLDGVTLEWLPVADPDSGIAYYAYALGTGVTPATEANLRWWQSTGSETRVRASLALTEGMTLYASVYAVNDAGAQSAKIGSGPLVVRREIFGDAANRISYTLAPAGIDTQGNPGAGWTPEIAGDIRAFLDRMLPVIQDLYGPPSISYTVTLVRDLQRTSSAIFYPHNDEIHLGDNAPYQLIAHELVHAWRNDRLLSSDASWRYDPTLSGFEEGFAQAVSYAAMTEFARRHPEFPLTEKLYQSSTEWDYDFQNTPELATTDFWSDGGGMNLFWIRYENSAAAIAKINTESPGFYRAFNAAYYDRLNATPALTSTRALVVDIIAGIAPVIEGAPAAAWIDRQHVFAARDVPGPKIWRMVQHYPGSDYHVFSRIYTYDTFENGSDWAIRAGAGWRYYNANGSTGLATMRDATGTVLVTRALAISPTLNPPALMRIGNDTLNLTTANSHLPWPGGEASRFITNVLPLALYRLDTAFISGTRAISNTGYEVLGSQLRNSAGVWGGVLGATTGTITITHQGHPAPLVMTIINGAFASTVGWASVPHTETGSIDSLPGTLNITLTLASQITYTDTRAIQYGSWNGTQAFLLDPGAMHCLSCAALTERVYLPGVAH